MIFLKLTIYIGISDTGTILEWGECLPDCPQEDVTAVCIMEPGRNNKNIGHFTN